MGGGQDAQATVSSPPGVKIIRAGVKIPREILTPGVKLPRGQDKPVHLYNWPTNCDLLLNNSHARADLFRF